MTKNSERKIPWLETMILAICALYFVFIVVAIQIGPHSYAINYFIYRYFNIISVIYIFAILACIIVYKSDKRNGNNTRAAWALFLAVASFVLAVFGILVALHNCCEGIGIRNIFIS